MTNDADQAAEAEAPLEGQAGGDLLARMTAASRELSQRYGLWPEVHLDSSFVGFLKLMSRFDVFAFGPLTVYVPEVERALAARPQSTDPELFVRFSALLQQEVARGGGGPINELHVLLAFMRLGGGLPARVFGELGVRPEQVEDFARSGGRADAPLERLYSPEDAAAYLGIHVETVRSWIRSGRLRAHRLTGQRALRIKASDLASVLEPVLPSDEASTAE